MARSHAQALRRAAGNARTGAAGRAERKTPRTREVALPQLSIGRVSLIAGALGLVTLVLYFPLVARDIAVGDSPEFIVAGATLGIAHPPGYPVLTVLGHLASLVPLGDLPFRVNVLSAIFDAATVSIVFVTAARLTRSLTASALAAVVLAANELFMRWSLVAEAFPLNDLIAAALVLCLVLWHERPERARYLVAAAFLGGLGMANHQTIVLLGIGILFVLADRRRTLFRRPEIILWSTVAVFIGLVPYAYLLWAATQDPILNWGMATGSFGELVAHFLRTAYGTTQLVPEGGYQGGSAVARVLALLLSFGAVLGVLAVAGAYEAYRRQRWYFWFTLLSFVVAGPAFAVYSNINLSIQGATFVLQRFFLLSIVVVAPLAALGVELVQRLVRERLPSAAWLSRYAVPVVVVVAVAVSDIGAVPRVDMSSDHVARNYGEDILASMGEDSVLLTGADQSVLPLEYLQNVEHIRPDVTVVMLGLLKGDWYVTQLRHRTDLRIPFVRYDGRSATLKNLVDANPTKHFYVLDETLPDDSLSSAYWYYSHGLVEEVLPMAQDRELPQLVADNEHLLSTFRVPSLSTVKKDSFERKILSEYALVAYRVGSQQESLQQLDQARTWYQRALAIDPELTKALEATDRLAR